MFTRMTPGINTITFYPLPPKLINMIMGERKQQHIR